MKLNKKIKNNLIKNFNLLFEKNKRRIIRNKVYLENLRAIQIYFKNNSKLYQK